MIWKNNMNNWKKKVSLIVSKKLYSLSKGKEKYFIQFLKILENLNINYNYFLN
jgi:hypothetical protein